MSKVLTLRCKVGRVARTVEGLQLQDRQSQLQKAAAVTERRHHPIAAQCTAERHVISKAEE